MAGYGELLHGEAVSLGMVVAATMARQAGMFPKSGLIRQNKLLKALGLPVTYTGHVQVKDILSAIQLDKKVAHKQMRWVMPQRLGDVTVTSMPDDLVKSVLSAFFTEQRP